MTKILVKFWLLRFAQVFILACAVLGVIEWMQRGSVEFDYASVLGWAALTALSTATVSAHWAYKRQCKQVFKDPT